MALCNECKKNTAVVFVNKVVNGVPSVEGLCLACAKKKGINPLSSLMKQYGATDEEIDNMNRQFDEIIESMDNNPDGNPLSEMMGGMGLDGMPSFDGMTGEENENPGGTPIDAFTRMLDKMISGLNNGPKEANYQDEDKSQNKSTETKTTQKKPKEKKRKYLDAFGTNLTTKFTHTTALFFLQTLHKSNVSFLIYY